MKTTTAAVLLVAAVASTPTLPAPAALAAAAAAPQCQGQPATLVGSPGTRQLRGTAGPDVVVSNGAARVETGDGDDVVCITGRTRGAKRMNLDAGAGDDAVTVTAGNAVRARLGDGDDTFFGRSEADTVLAGYFDDGLVDTGVDTIHTGAGPDDVRSNGGDDTISLGKGADDLQWTASTRPADGGRGRDRLIIIALVDDSVLDNRTGTLTADGQVISRWSSFASFVIGGPVSLVRGSGEDESFSAATVGGVSEQWTIRAGGGDDVLQGTSGEDTLLGGPGDDRADGRLGDDRCVAERRVHCES